MRAGKVRSVPACSRWRNFPCGLELSCLLVAQRGAAGAPCCFKSTAHLSPVPFRLLLQPRWAECGGHPSPPSLFLLLLLSRAHVPVTKGTSQSWWPLDTESRAERFLDARTSHCVDKEHTGRELRREEQDERMPTCGDGEKLRSPELSSLGPLTLLPPLNVPNHAFHLTGASRLAHRSQV